MLFAWSDGDKLSFHDHDVLLIIVAYGVHLCWTWQLLGLSGCNCFFPDYSEAMLISDLLEMLLSCGSNFKWPSTVLLRCILKRPDCMEYLQKK